MTHRYIRVSRLGAAFLPAKFAEAGYGGPARHVEADEASRAQAIRFLARGGTLVVTGEWSEVCAFRNEILKRENELLPEKADRRERQLISRNLRLRLLTTVDCLPQTQTGFETDELAGFLGEGSLPDGLPVLLPVDEAERLLEIPSNRCPVRAIDAELVTHPDVLAPRSQETIDLVCEALRSCKPDLPDSPEVLDLGCGSGVLTIAAWQILGEKSPT
ncbi:MAG: hypothetical protein ACPL7K_10215, partial [Armatimonadota bacterium]